MSLRTFTTFSVAIAISLTTQTAFAAPVNTPPVANNDTTTTLVSTAVLIAVLANDTTANGNPIDPKSVKVERLPRSGVTAPQSGQLRYTSVPGFVGTDSFTYTVKGIRGAKSNQATVTVTVQANVAPVAINDSAMTDVNILVVIPILANDTDANGNLDPTTVMIATGPAHGTAVSNTDGTVTYTPDLGFFGTDSFTYNVKDTSQGATSNTATVTVGINAAPVADAGPDANAVIDQLVALNGSGPSDPNGR